MTHLALLAGTHMFGNLVCKVLPPISVRHPSIRPFFSSVAAFFVCCRKDPSLVDFRVHHSTQRHVFAGSLEEMPFMDHESEGLRLELSKLLGGQMGGLLQGRQVAAYSDRLLAVSRLQLLSLFWVPLLLLRPFLLLFFVSNLFLLSVTSVILL